MCDDAAESRSSESNSKELRLAVVFDLRLTQKRADSVHHLAKVIWLLHGIEYARAQAKELRGV